MRRRDSRAARRFSRSFALWLTMALWLTTLAGCGNATSTPIPTPLPAVLPTPSPTSEASEPATLFFASDQAGNGDIYRIDGGGLRRLTDNPEVDWDPAVSPDGTRIAFTSWRAGQADIWLMNTDGSELRRLTDHPADDYAPAWSPDGRALAFVSERAGNQDIFLLDVTTGAVRPLVQTPRAERDPAWSPDGKRLAFVGIDAESGWQRLWIVTTDGLGPTPLTNWPIHASSPLWLPDGKSLLFLGREHDGAPLGFFIIHPGEPPQPLWMTPEDGKTIVSAPAWGPNGMLLFALWRDGMYSLVALSPGSDQPIPWLTGSDVYGAPVASPAEGPYTRPLSSLRLGRGPKNEGGHEDHPLILGMNLAGIGNAYLVRDLGFTWAKGYLSWESAEPERGHYYWVDADNIVNAYETQELKILLRVHQAPAWARPLGTPISHPPRDPADLAHFLGVLAARYRGRIHAYEIWNEPNLAYEWGDTWPDPYFYAEMLKQAYPAIKAADPEASVIAGGVATTGPGSPTAVGDLDWLRAFYAGGARGFFDALSTHPYGFGKPPDVHDPWGLSLDRVVAQRQIMVDNGDESTPMWITEMGWPIRTPAWDLGEHQPFTVSEVEQAEYLVEALDRIVREWPWIEAVFPFNLDFSTVTWYPAQEQMRWYALLNPDGSPRLSYTRLRRWARGLE
ncbi:MAG: cellulase family glycosylhydrolase [Anaerolineae bacterium]|nr:cellulase family glycosylhydrolase [Anaerolineae bacterium]MDW8101097.1 cellulase family glycosylhydrolase [Anaerolineae bacterium]